MTDLTALDKKVIDIYTLHAARHVIDDALQSLENCTEPLTQSAFGIGHPKGEPIPMAKLHRHRVQIGLNGEGQPIVKWAHGATIDELNDSIPLDPQLVMLLQPFSGATGFIIGGEKPISRTAYINIFKRVEQKVDLQGATAHVFRHSYLTLLDEAGVSPKIIQAIAGHGDIKITMNRYVHEREKDVISAGDKFNSLLESATEEQQPE